MRRGRDRARLVPRVSDLPLKVGTYEIRLLMDDGYRTLAISDSLKVVHAD